MSNMQKQVCENYLQALRGGESILARANYLDDMSEKFVKERGTLDKEGLLYKAFALELRNFYSEMFD